MELQQHIRAIAYVVAGIGILLSIVASLWITSRLSRPIERLARRLAKWQQDSGTRRSRLIRTTKWARWHTASMR